MFTNVVQREELIPTLGTGVFTLKSSVNPLLPAATQVIFPRR
jgi:hypothetical protein